MRKMAYESKSLNTGMGELRGMVSNLRKDSASSSASHSQGALAAFLEQMKDLGNLLNTGLIDQDEFDTIKKDAKKTYNKANGKGGSSK